ncbi:hypothetical protein GLU64_00635 [Nanohaloarchaea archaeon]|nr:hypothetical protein [Candidatus Nanohaloarchaea archaeon]
MKTISAIFAILLVFLFLGPLAAFIITAGEAAQQAGGTGAQINNTRAMTQFIMYSTITAYQCSPGGGGYEKGRSDLGGGTFWGSWETLRDTARNHNNFEQLNNSYPRKTQLNCYGVEEKIPFSQGPDDEVNPVDDDSWINDQQGKFSKRSFEITEKTGSGEEGVQLGPCLAYENTYGDAKVGFSYMIAGANEPNVIQFAHNALGGGPFTAPNPENLEGNGFSEEGGEVIEPIQQSDCMSPTYDDHYPETGPLAMLTVIGADQESLDGTKATELDEGFNACDTGSAAPDCSGPGSNGPGPVLKEYRLCPGTKGYIQTNTGKNKWEKVGGNFEGPAGYTADNPPGKPDIEAAGDSKANRIHPYIVLTEVKHDCAEGPD